MFGTSGVQSIKLSMSPAQESQPKTDCKIILQYVSVLNAEVFSFRIEHSIGSELWSHAQPVAGLGRHVPSQSTMFVPLILCDLTRSACERKANRLTYSRCPANTTDLATPLCPAIVSNPSVCYSVDTTLQATNSV